jgi:tRNA1(Val) A37 N6-methylase TrmN6
MSSVRVDPAIAAGTTDDVFLGGAIRLLQPVQGHRAGHDAMLLAAAAPAATRAVDFGAGTGAAGLALIARNAAQHVTLVEIDAGLAAIARENAARNGFADRANVIADDVTAPNLVAAGAFDLVVMNPPFNDESRYRASPDAARARAHVGNDATLAGWIDAAHRALVTGGCLTLIHRPEATLRILKSLDGRFGAIELIPVFSKPDSAAIRLIVRAIKGRKTPATLHPGVTLSDLNGKPSAEAERILRHGGALNAII